MLPAAGWRLEFRGLRAYVTCRRDNETVRWTNRYSPIEGGDLLTTSPIHGDAMKADDPIRAFGVSSEKRQTIAPQRLRLDTQFDCAAIGETIVDRDTIEVPVRGMLGYCKTMFRTKMPAELGSNGLDAALSNSDWPGRSSVKPLADLRVHLNLGPRPTSETEGRMEGDHVFSRVLRWCNRF
jgi:hypothetical protein